MKTFKKWPEGISAPTRVFSKYTEREQQQYGGMVEYAMKQVIGYEHQDMKLFSEPTCINVTKTAHDTVVVRLVKPSTEPKAQPKAQQDVSHSSSDYVDPVGFMDELNDMRKGIAS